MLNQEMEVCQAYQKGQSQRAVAALFGMSQTTIGNVLRKHGILTRPKHSGIVAFAKNATRQAERAEKLRGKPSGALGKSWTVDRPIVKPSLRGQGNPNWRGGRTSLAKLIRNSAPYGRWRAAVFKRDDYTCQSCGVRPVRGNDVRLEADHVQQFAHLLKKHHIETVEAALACDALWQVELGQTLCRDCHKNTLTFGNKGSLASA